MEIIDYWNQFQGGTHEDGLSSKYLRRTPSNPRPITPPKPPYGVLWPRHLRYVPPSLSSLSPELITYRIPNVYDALFRQVRSNQVTFGDQLPPPFGQYPSPSGQSDSWWGRGIQAVGSDDFLEADPNYRPPYFDPPDPPSQGSRPQARPIPTVDPYPSSAPSYQEAASAARTRQAYAAGSTPPGPSQGIQLYTARVDDPGSKPSDKMPNASASAKGFTAGGRIAPGTIAHSLTNLGPVDALFSLGSAPFTYAGYKSFGATNPQALIGTIGTEGGGVFGGLAGARLGATAGSLFGPIGATGGAILGAVIGGQAGFRLGGKAADELSGLNEANRMRQQQPMYDPQTGQQYMASPPPPTPQERMRNEILSSAHNPYMPYMMAQLGGYYA